MKIIVILLFIAVAFFLWRFVVRGDALVFVDTNPGKRVSASVARVIPNKEIVIEVDNNSKENSIVEISVPRTVASRMGLSAPVGFIEESLPLTSAELKDKETVEFAAKYNKEKVRWVGSLAVPPDGRVELTFPASSTVELTGTIDFRYEAKRGFGGSISYFHVKLNCDDLPSLGEYSHEPRAKGEREQK